MTHSKIGPLMPRASNDVNRVRARHARGMNSLGKSPPRITYATIRIHDQYGNILRTKVSLDTAPVDSHLGNAILEAIAASGATAPVRVMLRLG